MLNPRNKRVTGQSLLQEEARLKQKENQINSQLFFPVVDRVSDPAISRMDAIIQHSNGGIIKWIWSTNWSRGADLLPPTGGAALIDATKPFSAEVFHPQKMFSGVSILKIPHNAKTNSGKPFNLEYLIMNQDKIKDRMADLIQCTEGPRETLAECNDAVLNHRNRPIVDIGGSPSHFAGVFYCDEKIHGGYRNDFYLVVQSGMKKASEELFQEMEDVAAENTQGSAKVSFANYFKDSISVRNLKLANSCHRKEVLAKLCVALDIDKEVDGYNSTPIENTKYNITNISNQHMVYNAGTMTILSHINEPFNHFDVPFLAITENPAHGISLVTCSKPTTLISSPSALITSTSPIDSKTSEQHFSHMAFPLSTGRITHTAPSDPFPFDHDNEVHINIKKRFVWDDLPGSTEVPPVFHPTTFRTMDGKFVNKLKTDFGLVSRLQLKPVVVRIPSQ